MGVAKPAVARGKHLLIRAALKLALKTRSIGALGVREIGREAGLNPNTFYRHFSSLDDLGIAIVDEVMSDLRGPLRDIRRRAAEAVSSVTPGAATPTEYWSHCLKKAKVVARQTMALYFDFVLKNPEAFLIGVSELSGSSSQLRQKLSEALEAMSNDLAEDIRIYQLLPMLSDYAVREMSSFITRHIFILSTEYIDAPKKRTDMEEAAYSLMINLVAGAIAMEVIDRDIMAELVAILRDKD